MTKKSKDKVLPTLVTFLLDRTQSMGKIRDETIEGFNAYLETLKKDGGNAIKFTRLQFDKHHTNCDIQKDCVAEPIANVKPLTRETYQPRGWTPLIDAAYKTIQAVEASLKKFDTKHQVIVCIQTDGEENSSKEHTWDELKALIAEKTKADWVFNFMGTGIDAYAQGARMGIAATNTMSTGMTPENVRASYASMGASNMRFAATGDVSLSAFNAAERHASGEDTIMKGRQRPPMSTMPAPGSTNFDLSPGSSNSSAGGGLDLTP